ncbi:MAG TPA: M56 family metallopeptidase [Caulobacteraceae bacterium]|jgi:beta-lactamase regulating signal transducer with metallopeptidase domain|nr:M56 family metallopeptidase [Caulobacteraceae bacterium]
MNALLVVMALAVLAAWPLCALGSVIGLLAERLTRSPRVRELAWGAALVLPLLFLLQVLGERIVAESLAAAPVAAAHAARVQLTLPLSSATALSAPPLFERLLARPETVWIAGAVLGLSLVGMIVRLAIWFGGAQRLAHVVRRATPLPSIGSLAAGAPPILVSDEIDRPMLAGLRRPAILISAKVAQAVDAERLRLIGRHELAHLRRGDNLRRPLEEALLGFYWLTPPLCLVRARMAAATEEACDAYALADAGSSLRRVYAQALVDTLRLGAGPEHAPAFIGSGRRSRLMRMNAILDPARPARPLTIALLCGAGAALVIGAGFAAKSADAQASAAQPDPAPAQAMLTVTTKDVSGPREHKAKAVKLSLDGDVKVDGKRVSLKGKPMTVLVDTTDSKLVRVKATLDIDKDTKAVVEETIDPKGLKVEDGDTVYVLQSDGKTPQSYAITASGEKREFYVLKGGVTVTRDRREPDPQTSGDASHADGRYSSDDHGDNSVDIQADQVTQDKATGVSTYIGHPTVRVGGSGLLPLGTYQLNGKPVPADFNPNSLSPDQIDRIEVKMDGTAASYVNLVTKTPAATNSPG